MKNYSSYKNTGVDWLEFIPSHWSLRKMKYTFAEKSDKGYASLPLLSATQNHGVIKKSEYENRTVEATKSLETLKLVEVGDFVISLRSFQGGIEYSYERGIISPAYTILRPTHILASYFKYLGKSPAFIQLLKSMVTGIREGQNIDYSKLRENLLPIPPKKEQEFIASYLDAATAKIDEAIAQQQRMIDLLNERKQVIIDKTTTKGVFSEKELHDSGVDYIGKIPEGWTTTKIKFVASYNDEVLSEDSADKDIEYVEIGDVQYGKGITSSANYLFKDAPSRARRITKKGDIIVSTVRTYLKAVAVIKKDGLIVSTGFVVIRPKSNVDAQFLAYAILNSAIISEVEKNSVGTSYPAVNAWEVVDIKVPIPPIEEQKRIALYLSEIEKNTEKAIEGCGKIIQALQERKQIIINDVVTGKVRVV